jgi:hypothetical protein
MRDLFRTTALALVFTAGVAGAQTLPPNERAVPEAQTQPLNQNQAQPQNQNNERTQPEGQPIDHAQERAKQPDTNPGNIDGQQGNTAGRTPEKGQAIPLAPSQAEANGNTDGGIDVDIPGVTAQTIPSKFSEQIAEQDEIAIMARPIKLSDEQKAAIWKAIGDKTVPADASKGRIYAEAGVFLPPNVEAQAFPEGTGNIAALRGLKYVKAGDKVLLVQPANGVVRGVIEE